MPSSRAIRPGRALLIGLVLLLAAAIVREDRPAQAQVAATPAATRSPATAVVYLSIENDGDGADRLLGGETTAAEIVELHQTTDDNGILRMQPRPDGIEIPAGDETAFDEGGNHVMLVSLSADLIAGETYDLLLRFETAGEVTVPVQIRFNAEPDDDAPAQEPVTAGDLTITNAWTRPAPALLGLEPAGTPNPDAPAGFDTPVVAGDLTVTLTADGANAGPRDLTVFVTDASGAPVTDATVTIRTRSIEMDHGVGVKETEMVEPGRYLAETVPMGMGGDWQAEITIERPGADPIVVLFVITLEGPS